MYFEEYDYNDRIGIEAEVLRTLKHFGLKYRLKKSFLKGNLMEEQKRKESHVFGKPLQVLRMEEVILPQAKEPVDIPEFVLNACSHIEENLTVEGLFRKAGSSSRQREIKTWLDKGGKLDSSHHVIDVANILKSFLRELPEPLIPHKYHDTFLRCMLLKEKRDEAVILTCLLLPKDHLNTLAFFMAFLRNVASYADSNKMTISNLAIIIAPSVMPVDSQKITSQGNKIVSDHVEICQILIKNAHLIGVVPEHILSGEVSFSNSSIQNNSSDGSCRKKKKKRRSSSLTRVFNGLKKIMSGRTTPEFDSSRTPENEIHTPCIMSTCKKRKATESASAPLSSKKKREVMQSLPQGSVLSDTPYKSYFNHKEDKPTPRILVPVQKCVKSKTPPPKIKRRFFSKSSDGSSQKSGKSLSGSSLKVSRISLLGRSTRKKKEKEESIVSSDSNNLVKTDSADEIRSLNVNSNNESHQPSEEYVRVPKSEYEAIKARVSKIESRLSHEFENMDGVSISDAEITPDKFPVNTISAADQVQNVYKKTLRESDKFSNSSTEELAKLLSQELNIRCNPENKIIRSPSARKIGSIRRRSKENNVNINVDPCSFISSDGSCSLMFHPNKSLRRGKPNTVCTGLPHPNFKPGSMCIHNLSSQSNGTEPENDKEQFGILTRSQARRASSFHGISEQQQRLNQSKYIPDGKKIDWISCDKYFKDEKVSENDAEDNRRESIAKLRCQNAGMVLAKAKLFDKMGDKSISSKVNRNVSKTFRHNSVKTRSSMRRKHSDKKNQENSLKSVNLKHEFNNSPSSRMKNIKQNNVDKITCVVQNKNAHRTIDDHPLQKHKSKYGKENLFLQDEFAQTELITNTVGTITSPLKDSNRTPTIKRSLTDKLPAQLKRTPKYTKSMNYHTPVNSVPHIVTPRRSPRLLLKYNNIPVIASYK